jgi:hypothetical protein
MNEVFEGVKPSPIETEKVLSERDIHATYEKAITEKGYAVVSFDDDNQEVFVRSKYNHLIFPIPFNEIHQFMNHESGSDNPKSFVPTLTDVPKKEHESTPVLANGGVDIDPTKTDEDDKGVFTQYAVDVTPSEKIVRPSQAALDGLRRVYKSAELASDGTTIMLERENGQRFSTKGENAFRAIAAEAKRLKMEKEEKVAKENEIQRQNAQNALEAASVVAQEQLGNLSQEIKRREAANEVFSVPEDVDVIEEFDPLDIGDIKQIEQLKKESDKINFSVATVHLLERLGYKLAGTEPVLRDGKYYINVMRDGKRSSFTNSQAIAHLKKVARHSREFIAEEERQKKTDENKNVVVPPQVPQNPKGATSLEVREGNADEPFWESETIGTTVDGIYRDAAEKGQQQEALGKNIETDDARISLHEAEVERHPGTVGDEVQSGVDGNTVEESRLLREDEIAKGRSAFLKKYGSAVQQEAKEPPRFNGEEDKAPSRDPYWEALNQHISPENYNTYGFDSDQADAYWRAQQLTMNPEWANLSNEELLKKFEESRAGGKDVQENEEVKDDDPPSAPGHNPETPGAPEGGVDSKPTVQADGGGAGAESTPTQVDIELPIENKKGDAVRPDAPPKPEAPKPETPSTRSLDSIQSEIAYLEKIKSEVSYTSKEFRDKYGLDKEFPRGNDAAAIMWIERKLGALKAEKRESASTAKGFFDERFEKQFGITREELSKIEGFEKLSNGQQTLIYESLKEYTEDESRGKFGAMWAGVKGVLGQTVESAPRKGALGIEAYSNFLAPLILSTAMYGPKVHIENGVALPDFIGMGYDREHREKQKAACDALNSAAHAFARIPASWQEDGNGVHIKDESRITTFFKEKFLGGTESRKRYRTYEVNAKAFEDAQIQFAEALAGTGIPDEQIIRKLIEVDTKVHQLRFIETDPEAAEILKSIPDTTFWKKVGGVVKAGGVYAGLGAVGRTMTGNALGVMSGPLVAATLAGTRAWNKTAAEQRERDRKARMGIEQTDPKYEALLKNVKIAYERDPNRKQNEAIDKRYQDNPAGVYERGVWGKEYRDAVKELDSYKGSGALNIVKSEQKVQTSEGERDMGVTAKLERLVAEFRNLPEDADPKERARLLNQLRARTTYSQDKFNLDRIQFGDRKSFAVNQARFFEALANAQVIVFKEGGGPESRLDGRLGSYLDYRESAMNDRRHREGKKRVAVASTVAAGMSLAGAYAVQEFTKSGMGDRVVERIKGGAGRVKDWLTFDTAPESGGEGSDTEGKQDFVMPEQTEKPVKMMSEADIPQTGQSEQVEPLTSSGAVPLEVVGTEPEDTPAKPVNEPSNEIPSQKDIDVVIEERARALESRFIAETVPPKEWEKIRGRDADTFIKRMTARSAFLEKYAPSTIGRGQPTQSELLGRFARVLDSAKQYGIVPVKGESIEAFTHRVFVANEQVSEKERIMNLFGVSPETLPKGEMLPQSSRNFPTPGERADVQKLFAVEQQIPMSQREVMPGIDAMNLKPGRVLQGHYVQNYLPEMRVPPNYWVQARDKSVELFIVDAMERGTYAERTPALRQLGSVLRGIQQPPYNVLPRKGETTDVFMRRAFSVLKQAQYQGTNTGNMQEFLREVETPQSRIRR